MTTLEIEATRTMQVPAARVWGRIRDFGDCGWVSDTARVSVDAYGVGAIRTVSLEDGSRVLEQMTARDDGARTLRYRILESRLPICGYEAALTVTALSEDRCQVAWAARFQSDDAVRAERIRCGFSELFHRALERLEASTSGT